MSNYSNMKFYSVVALLALAVPGFAASKVRYLALGDSISFGYVPLPLPQPITSYVGYPEILDQLIPQQYVNLSCPGQSSASFLYGTAAAATEVPNENCEFQSQSFPGWKAAGLPLHTPYTGTQADNAVAQLLANKNIDLVTISLGGNDLLFLQYSCGGPASPTFVTCVQSALLDPNGPLTAYANNLAIILTRIRSEANYTGKIVLMKYFATSTDPLVNQAIQALNQAMTLVGAQFGAKMADGYAAFQIASIPYGGDPCKAGLLSRLSPTTCDVHPSLLGQGVLAGAAYIAMQEK
jgi:lysophospholipase L1-like esterase